jgi:hypothetical protein
MIKRIDGCWYRTLDLDAGIHAYVGPRGANRFWHGYYSGKAIDHSTGGVVPIVDAHERRVEWLELSGGRYEPTESSGLIPLGQPCWPSGSSGRRSAVQPVV